MARGIPGAIIPVAGLATRLRPLTRVVPKALFPLIGGDGLVRPVAEWIAREALEAGCERICFVTSPGQDGPLREYFAAEGDLAGRIEYVSGVEPFGFGYAVFAARAFARGDPVMILLGDHIHLPAEGAPAPTAQVVEAFSQTAPSAMVGVQVVGETELERVGVCCGESLGGSVYRCTELLEKPDPATAAERLATPGLPERTYLAHAGIYAFTAEIFQCLEPLVAARAEGAEAGLTEAQQALLAGARGEYLLCRIAGTTHDVGTPAGYLATQRAISDRQSDVAR